MTSLTDWQASAVEWFLALEPKVGLISGPPGTGKTLIALEIVRQFAAEGRTLVVVPARVLVEQWVSAAGAVGLAATELRQGSLDQSAAGFETGTRVWVTTRDLLRRAPVAELVGAVDWKLEVLDEAHHLGWALGPAGERSRLYLTATPARLLDDVPGLPHYFLDSWSASPVRERQDIVVPTPQEYVLLAAMRQWAGEAAGAIERFRRQLAAGAALAGVQGTIETLEVLLARGAATNSDSSPSDEDGNEPPHRLQPGERRQIEALLDLAYEVPSPDSRTVHLVEVITAHPANTVVVVASRVTQLQYVAELLRRRGVPVVVITGALAPDERGSAARHADETGSVVLLSDASVGVPLSASRTTLVHADVPGEERKTARLSLMVGWARIPQHVLSVTVRWAANESEG